jgi:hypothetical protein
VLVRAGVLHVELEEVAAAPAKRAAKKGAKTTAKKKAARPEGPRARFRLTAGQVLRAPRGQAHGFAAGAEGAELLITESAGYAKGYVVIDPARAAAHSPLAVITQRQNAQGGATNRPLHAGKIPKNAGSRVATNHASAVDRMLRRGGVVNTDPALAKVDHLRTVRQGRANAPETMGAVGVNVQPEAIYEE